MTEPPLEIRRHSPPGFARRGSQPIAALASVPDDSAATNEASATNSVADASRRQAEDRAPNARRARQRTQTPRRDAPPERDASISYAGAASVQFNVRLLAPLHERYARLVRRLADEGFKTTSTEIVHALLHEGPDDPDAARELVRRWRRVRAED